MDKEITELATVAMYEYRDDDGVGNGDDGAVGSPLDPGLDEGDIDGGSPLHEGDDDDESSGLMEQ